MAEAEKKKAEKKRILFPLGPALATVKWLDIEESSLKGTPLVRFTLVGEAGSSSGKTIYYRTYLTDSSVWKFEDMAIAVGVNHSEALNAAQSGAAMKLLKMFMDKGIKIVVNKEEFTDSDGITREGREIVALDSLNPMLRKYLERRRKARMSGGALNEEPPSDTSQSEDVPF